MLYEVLVFSDMVSSVGNIFFAVFFAVVIANIGFSLKMEKWNNLQFYLYIYIHIYIYIHTYIYIYA